MRATSGSVVIVNPTTEFLKSRPQSVCPPIRRFETSAWRGNHRLGRANRQACPHRRHPQDPRYILARENVLSELAVPFEIAGQGRGVLNVDSDRLNAFDEADKQALNDLAALASNVIKTPGSTNKFG